MTIPKEVQQIIEELNRNNFVAHAVGGCVRDLLMRRVPKDWDVTTNATPEHIQKIFSADNKELSADALEVGYETFYENDFGTVGVKTRSEDPSLAVVEVTTYRTETGYSDKRHPDEVKFASNLQEDLKRRDFTINAIAMDAAGHLTDPYGGKDDIKAKIIRAVGDPEERFSEDALRMLRAIRFAGTLGFAIEEHTLEEVKAHVNHLKHVSAERIRDEFLKLLMGDHAPQAMELLRETELLEYILPELLEGYGVSQNLHHIYTVWEHNVRSLAYSVEQGYGLEVRLAALLHDVGKPRAKRGEGHHATFYGHEVIGARMAAKALERLKFPKEMADKIAKLIRYHMFYYLPDEVTESSVRRLVANIGKENVEDLLKLREADRIGSGTPKAIPYKLRHLKFMIDKVARDPISPKMLKVDGNDIMTLLDMKPGRTVGMIMNALMEEVLEDPKKNTKEYLEARTKALAAMPEEKLAELAKQGKEKTQELEEEEVGKIKQKHYVS